MTVSYKRQEVGDVEVSYREAETRTAQTVGGFFEENLRRNLKMETASDQAVFTEVRKREDHF